MTPPEAAREHVCNAWCRPPVHCGIVFATSDDTHAVYHAITHTIARLRVMLIVIRVERAIDAPPRSFFGTRLSSLETQPTPLDDTAIAYRVYYRTLEEEEDDDDATS